MPQLTFTPTVVAGERLQRTENAEGADGAIYRARYPLWRMGQPFTGWSSLPADIAAAKDLPLDGLNNPAFGSWARDPLLTIWRYLPSGTAGRYTPEGIAAFDPRTRTMRAFDLGREGAMHDTSYDASMPYLKSGNATARTRPRFVFSVDWVDGSLRFDYPLALTTGKPSPDDATFMPIVKPLSENSLALGIPLSAYWESPPANGDLRLFLVPDSVVVKRVQLPATTTSPAPPTRVLAVLKQVASTPHEGRDEYRIGLTNGATDPVPYGWIQLPEYVVGNATAGTKSADATFVIEFRWRSNGVLTMDYDSSGNPIGLVEKPDIVTAYYRTAAVIDVGVTVSRADPSAEIGKRIAQSAYLTRRVKLHNLLREIRYAEK